jgi:hypothetical protein
LRCHGRFDGFAQSNHDIEDSPICLPNNSSYSPDPHSRPIAHSDTPNRTSPLFGSPIDSKFAASFENHQGPSRIRREVRALLNEAVHFVGCFPELKVDPTVHMSPIYSPFHERFRGSLQNGSVATVSNQKNIMKKKPYDPKSVGGLVLKPGQWKCSVCTSINSHRPVYDCVVCRQTPTRSCQINSTSLVHRSKDFIEEPSDGSVVSDGSEGEAYDIVDEKELETFRRQLQFGETLSRHKHVAQSNLLINLEWREYEATHMSCNRFSICLPPKNIQNSYQKLALSWTFRNQQLCRSSLVIRMLFKSLLAITWSWRFLYTTRRILSSANMVWRKLSNSSAETF